MDGTKDFHTDSSNLERERQTLYDITYMWSLKYGTNDLSTRQKYHGYVGHTCLLGEGAGIGTLGLVDENCCIWSGWVMGSCCIAQGNVCNRFFFFLVFCLFRAAPMAYGGSQARGQIGAVPNGLCHSHSNAGSEPHLRPTPQLMAMPDP